MDLQPAALRPSAAGAYIGVGRTKIFALIREGRIQAVKIDGCTVITRESLDKLLETAPSASVTGNVGGGE